MNLARFAFPLVMIGASLMSTTTAQAAYQHAGYDVATDGELGLPFERFDAANWASVIPASPYFGLGYSPTGAGVTGGAYFSGESDANKYTFWYLPTLTLDASAGIELAARLKIGSSSSTSTDRAGVALALTDSTNQYTELYIGEDGVFLNGVGRTHGIGDAFAIDTQAGFHDYLLRVQGSAITVLIDGVAVLSGMTFDASTSGAPTLANWAVFGDITQSASGSYFMESVSVTVVPEPMGLMACGMLVPLLMRRRGAL